jgi:hypothetical protein
MTIAEDRDIGTLTTPEEVLVMRRSWRWLVPACCGLALVAGCERRGTEDEQQLEQVRKEAKEDVERARKEAAEKVEAAERNLREQREKSDAGASADRATYAARVKQDVTLLDTEIGDLRAHAQKATGAEKRGLEEALSRIDQNRKALGTKIDKIETAGAVDSHGLRNEIETSLRDLRKEVQSARDRWKPPGKT